MTETNQTTLDWDSVENPTMLSVKDVREGDKVIPVTGTDGQIVETQSMSFTNDDGVSVDTIAYVLNCKVNGTEQRLRINRSVLWNLKQWRAGKDENLIGKEFKIQFKGTGKFASIQLIRAGSA